MIRRAIVAVFAAALLVLAPSAALGYSEDDFDVTVSTTNPAPGEAFTVTVTAPSGTDVTLTVTSDDANVGDDDILIAGTKALTKTAVDGQAVFSVTLLEEGAYDLVATDAEGNVLDTITVVVGEGSGAPVTTDGGATGLPETGATATPLIIGGALLLLVGAAAIYFTRRMKVSA
ncbi:LPXTG cell wall anchor domain-containing protein [Georgenia sp. 311]|uniref:LPXTG cell wall anchor domain-containing protein n=1 Tax=Georgenia sp. 311 TaxID=2585134 RepID=UPI00111244F9|nr:LPXTG cell wall anchor domain-containing protein [Georgenia sp. 311]TNC19709.1 LPXTG cell wall anchor domain-containing protein [Georgenia sp. 311]